MRFRLIAHEAARYALRYPNATELRRFSIKKIEDTVQREYAKDRSQKKKPELLCLQIYCGITFL